MLNGVYRTFDSFEEYDVTIEVKETEKSYVFRLVKNDSRYSPARFDMMFSKTDKVSFRKDKSPHAVLEYNDGEEFVIYPYRGGVPYLFELVKDKECEMKDKRKVTPRNTLISWMKEDNLDTSEDAVSEMFDIVMKAKTERDMTFEQAYCYAYIKQLQRKCAEQLQKM